MNDVYDAIFCREKLLRDCVVLSLLQKYREIFEETNFAPKYFSF